MLRSIQATCLAACLLAIASEGFAADSLAVAPPLDIQERVRHEVGSKPVRLTVAEGAYELDRIRLDGAGAAFTPEAQQPLARWSHGDKQAPPPLASPVAWGRIETMDAKHSGAKRGALIGMIALPLAILAWPKDDPENWDTVYALVSIPIGATVGGLVGAMVPAWVRVWPRNEALNEPSRR